MACQYQPSIGRDFESTDSKCFTWIVKRMPNAIIQRAERNACQQQPNEDQAKEKKNGASDRKPFASDINIKNLTFSFSIAP
jgi:hypothetical protein